MRERVWDEGYEVGYEDAIFEQRGLSTDSDADQYPHENPYRGLESADIDVAALRAAAEGATPGPWVVFDMDEAAHCKEEPLNAPGEGWYWVWQESRLPYYGGVLRPEKHHPSCDGKPSLCCGGPAIGSSRINDPGGGLQEQADARFIAASNPAVVLALLDELEGLRRQVGERR